MATDYERARDTLGKELRTKVNGIEIRDNDNLLNRNTFNIGERVFLRCVYRGLPNGAWEIEDQTGVELEGKDISNADGGATALVECEVTGRVDDQKIRLGNPTIIVLEVADGTVEQFS